MKPLLLFLALIVSTGCTNMVGTHFEKTITIRKDADGKVIERVEFERIFQPNIPTEFMKMQYLDSPKRIEMGAPANPKGR